MTIFLGALPSSMRAMRSRDKTCLRPRLRSALGDGDFPAPLAINLDRQGNGVVDQQRRIDGGPGRIGHQTALAQGFPAGFGQMRHHRGDELDQALHALGKGADAACRACRNQAGGADQDIGQLIDLGDGAVEAQAFDIVCDLLDGAVGILRSDSASSSSKPRTISADCLVKSTVSQTRRQMRCWKRLAPSTPDSVH